QASLTKRLKNYRAALADGRADAQTCYPVWKALVSARLQTTVLKGQLAQAVVALQSATGFYEIPRRGQAAAKVKKGRIR
ncbi:hypothetical protein MNBD_DELTA03-1841, partial [hydrothermal vent metagenome]